MIFRESCPKRSSNVEHKNDYRDYRSQLMTDFNHRCGYCGDIDNPRIDRYEIDHFVPKTLDESKETDYSNLVYSCKSCNNSKSNKWPTNDVSKSNDGNVGWIDPCSEEYGQQFERNNYGSIIPLTQLGLWMYENLKLWKSQHSYLWCIEYIGNQLDEIKEYFQQIKDPKKLHEIIEIHFQYEELIKKIFL